MIHRVATTYGQSPMVVDAWPFALTLYWFFQITEHERISTLMERFREMSFAGLVALAFHEPKKLVDAQRELQHEAGMFDSVDADRAKAAQMLADLGTINWTEAT